MDPCGSPSTLPLLWLLIGSKLGSRSCYSGRQLLRDYAAREFNAFLWISLIAVTLFLLRRVVRLFRLWSEGSKIPGPPCASFYGHCNLFSRENFAEVLSGLHDKYGSIFKLWLGPSKLLVSINDPEVIKEILFKAEDKLPLTGRAYRLAFGRTSLFTSSYLEVKRSRMEEFDKASFSLLFVPKIMRELCFMYIIIVQKRRQLLAAELDIWLLKRINVIPGAVSNSIKDKINIAMARGSANCEEVLQHMAFSTLGAMLFGETLFAWSKASIYEELLVSIAKHAFLWASYSITPFWRRGFWEYKSLTLNLRCLTQEIIQLCSKNRALHLNNQKLSANLRGGVEAARGGLACSSVMMSGSFIADEKCSHIYLNEEHSANIMGIMFHSYLTTAGLICNVLATLAKHPEIQDQIYSEIFMARKGSLKEDKQNADHMVLLAATVYESARLLPAWTLLQRCSLENAGAGLIVPVQLVQMDSSSWGKDASEFNPCRFISTVKGESDSSNTTGEAGLLRTRPFVLNDPNESAAFLPFGSGAHACVGQKFVIQAVVLLVASLLEQYEMKLKPGSDTNLKPSTNNSVLQLFLSLELVFIKRSN